MRSLARTYALSAIVGLFVAFAPRAEATPPSDPGTYDPLPVLERALLLFDRIERDALDGGPGWTAGRCRGMGHRLRSIHNRPRDRQVWRLARKAIELTLGRLARRCGQPGEAFDPLHQAASDGSCLAWVEFAELLCETDRLEDGVDRLARILPPSCARAHLLLARVERRTDAAPDVVDRHLAAARIERAEEAPLVEDPRLVRILEHLRPVQAAVAPAAWADTIRVQTERGTLDLARASCDRALSLHPHDGEVHRACGLVAEATGDIGMAVLRLETAVFHDPNLAPAWRDLARLEERLRRPERAARFRARADALGDRAHSCFAP